jgi:hypothetical protein
MEDLGQAPVIPGLWRLHVAGMLCACAGPKVAGGEVGGVVPLIGITQAQVLEMPQNHCATFGHVARTLAIRPEEGGKFVFECV